MHPRNLYVFITREHAYTIEHHLETWGRSLRQFVRPIFYEDLPHYRTLRPGTYIFSDLERLTEMRLELAAAAADALLTAGEPARVLNHPRQVLRREALLRKLHAECGNPFRVYHVGDDLSAARYPLFIRRENEHDGSLSPLIHGPAELPAALAQACKRGIRHSDLLIVEHCDTADAKGVYRKFSAFVIADRVFPYHINFAKHWVVKRNEHLTPELEAEEIAFRASPPHLPYLQKVFRSAGVQYGRMDFALRGEQVVVWEINTNPTLGGDPFRAKPHRLALIQSMVRDVNEGLASLRPEKEWPSAAAIPLHVPPQLLRQLGLGRTRRVARRARKALLRLLAD